MSELTVPLSPYKGLIPYAEEDALFFFGREQKREMITANLQASRLTVLHGPSGVGKSSVLRAGVAYHLQQLAMQTKPENGNPEFAVIVFSSWRDDPLMGLKTRIYDSVAQFLNGQRTSLSQSQGLEQYLKICTSSKREGDDPQGHNSTQPKPSLDLLIILDQFEEYFLYHAKEQGPGTLAMELPAAINSTELRVNFLISIREDALAKLERFKGTIPHIFENRLSLEHLDQGAAREAIIKPIDQYNRLAPAGEEPFSIQPALVEAILEQIRTGKVVLGQSGCGVVDASNSSPKTTQIETPYLQLVMTRLWEEEVNSGSRELRLETLNRLGGSASIVRTHLDKIMDTLTAEEQILASRIFYQLVTPGGTKIAHTVPDLAAFAKLPQDPPAPALVELLAKLSDNPGRILRPVDPPPNQQNMQRYEIFHDVLAPAVLDWQTRYMQAADRAKAEKRAAHEAAKREKDAANELRLQQAEDLIEAERLRAEEGRRRFEAERERAEAQRLRAEEERKRFEAERERAEEQKRRLEVERQRALEQHRRLEEQTKATKRLTRLAAALAVMVIFTIAAAALAATQKISADNASAALRVQTDRATKRAQEAQEATAKAVKAEGEARRDRDEARKATDLAELRRREAETAKIDARNAEKRAKQESIAATTFAGEATGTTLVAEGERLIEYNKDLTSGGLLLIKAAELDKRKEQREVVPISELIAVKKAAGEIEKPSLLQQLNGEDSLTHHAREIMRRMLPELNRRPQVLKADTGREVDDVAISPDNNYIVLITRKTRRDYTDLEDKNNGVSVWQRKQQAKAQVETDENWVPLKYELNAHEGVVVSAAFSSDSNYLVTGGMDKQARIWNLRDGGEPKILQGHIEAVTGVAFVPGHDDLVVTISEDKSIRIWQWRSPINDRNPKVLLGHTNGVHALALDPKGKFMATEAADGTARLWNLEDIIAGKQPVSVKLMGLLGPVATIAFSPQGDKLVTEGRLFCRAYVALVWDTNKIWNSFEGVAPENERVFDPDPDQAKDCAPSTNLAIPGAVTILRGHKAGLTSVSFGRNGRLIITASADETARIWDVISGSVVAELRGHTGPLTSAKFDPDDKYVVTAALDKGARLWDAEGNSLAVMRGHRNGLTAIEFSSDGNFIVTASTDGTARVWDTPKKRSLPERGITELRGHTAPVYSVAFSPDGKELLTGSFDLTSRLWDSYTGQQKKQNFGSASKAAFNKRGDLIVTAGGFVARVYNKNDVNEWERTAQLDHSNWQVLSAAFSANSDYIVTTSRLGDKGMVKVWKKKSQKDWVVEAEIPQSVFLFNAEFSPTNDQRLVTAGLDGKVRIWRKNSTTEWASLEGLVGHQKSVIGAHFSGDGKYIVSASWDQTAIVWKETEPDKWENSFTLGGHQGPVYSAAFSADGRSIVTASGDKTVGVWSKAQGDSWQLVSVLSNQEDSVFSAAFGSGDQLIATAGAEGKARVYSRVMFQPFAEVLQDALKLRPYLCGEGGIFVSALCDNEPIPTGRK